MVTCPGCGTQQADIALYCEKCGDPIFEGKQAGVYQIISRIGEGGMGSVYKAEHSKLGTPFALKLLHRQFTKRPELVTRFVNEARATSRLRHEHIVFITDFGELDGFGPYIAMEYLIGRTLKDALVPGDPMAIKRTFNIAIQLAGTMTYAHAQDLVHRDLKPDNIFLIDRDGATDDFIKVLDFGIAKTLQAESDTSLTQTGAVLGTPIYMSPEQALSKDLDHRADIYSFGIILFEMVTGFVPFQGNSAFELIEQRLFHEAPKISAYAPEWSGSPLETLVELCLMREPDERFQSMAEIKQKLERIFERHKLRETSHGQGPARDGSLGLAETAGLSQVGQGRAGFGEEPMAEAAPPSPEQTRLQETGAFAPRGQLPTGTMLGDLSDPNENFSAPYGASANLDVTGAEPIPGQKRLGLALVLLLCFCGVAGAGWYTLRKPPKPPKKRLIVVNVGKRLAPIVSKAPKVPDAAIPALRLPDATPVRRPTKRPVRRPRTRRPWRRRPWRRVAKRVVKRTVKRVIPVPRIPPPRRSKRPTLGPNGCLPRTDKITHTRMFANDGKVRVKIGRVAGRWGRALPKAKGGGWCIPVPRGGIHVRIFGGHRELADCWFRLGYFYKPKFKVKLRNLEDGGPGRYCQPR